MLSDSGRVKIEILAKSPTAETGESDEVGLQRDVKSENEVPLGATLPDPVRSDSSSNSRSLCRRAASAAGVEAASEHEAPSMPPSIRSGNCGTAQSAFRAGCKSDSELTDTGCISSHGCCPWRCSSGCNLLVHGAKRRKLRLRQRIRDFFGTCL